MGFRTKDKVDVRSKAPDFTLPSRSGEMVSLEDFLGEKPVVLFFYPKDDTPGCTKEACAFRDEYERLKLDAEVMGISSDSVESHERFEISTSCPFLCSAIGEGMLEGFTVLPTPWVCFPGRVTYVIDQEGVVRHVFTSQIGVEGASQKPFFVLPRQAVSR